MLQVVIVKQTSSETRLCALHGEAVPEHVPQTSNYRKVETEKMSSSVAARRRSECNSKDAAGTHTPESGKSCVTSFTDGSKAKRRKPLFDCSHGDVQRL